MKISSFWRRTNDSKKAIRKRLAQAATDAMYPSGTPKTGEEHSEVFELYKLMVASSESLVARRQGVNTFFLTINGLVLTAVGLFIRNGGNTGLQAGGIFVLTLVGIVLCYAWWSLLQSFGKLNSGKFTVINSLERQLAASIYAAEWEALGRGEIRWVYRSFTKSEAYVPLAVGVIYAVAALLSGLIWSGVWHLASHH